MRLFSGCRNFIFASSIADAVTVAATPGFADVASVQRELTELGYDLDPIDAIWAVGLKTQPMPFAVAAALASQPWSV